MPKRLTENIPAAGKLVEQELQKWILARRWRGQASDRVEPEVAEFICISRMVGIDAYDIASNLGRQLVWPVFGREILEAMAGDDMVRRRIYADMDQRDMSWWEESLRSVLDRSFVRNDYFRRLCETVLSLARQGHGVFVGRGTDLILPRDLGLRVRLVASLESRIDQLVTSTELDADQAQRHLVKIEQQRAEFFQHRFAVEAADPLRHDLVINLDRWAPDDVLELILEAHSRHSRLAVSVG